MKNTQKLFLIFLLIFGFLALNAGIVDAAITDGLPADIGEYSNLTVFDFSASGNPYLIAGEGNLNLLSFDGFRWDGTSWADSTVDSGLPNDIIDSFPAIFTMGGDWYLVTGKTDGTFEGFERPSGSGPWIASTIGDSLNPVGGSWSTPTIFPKDGWSTFPTGGKYLITGKDDGTFDGYKLGGGGNWVVSTIADSLPDVGHNSSITVFKMGANWYAITGDGTGQWNSFRWGGGAWVVDTVIDNGLPIHHHNTAPEVFNIGTQYYLIFGEREGKFFGFHWNSALQSWIEEVVDSIPPIITDLELIDQGDGDTYRGGITTFASLGNITINAEAMDNAGGSGVKNITICWKIGGMQDCDTSPDFLPSNPNPSWSRSINLSAHSGDTIKYWAKATDYGAPSNTAYSPDWGNPGNDGWYMKVKADITCPLAFFQYKHIPKSLFYQSPGAPAKLNHTFIFPAKSDDSYHITKMQSGIQSSDASNWRWLYSYKINNGANVNVDGNLESGAGNFTKTWTGDFSTSKNEKLKVKFSYGAFSGGVKRASNMLIEGSCGSCIVNGGACNADGDCCDNNCDNKICCATGHTCCSNDGHCPTDSCANACQLTDHSCDTTTDHYCKNTTDNCNGTACGCDAGGCACAAGNFYCDTDVCRDGPGWSHLCQMRCDGTGAAPAACAFFAVCDNHCINGEHDCDEGGVDCGGSCPNPCAEDCTVVGDEDGNGTADCLDPACPECTDCDGAAGANVCIGGNCIAPAAENCGDGKDNDCNGLTDCKDTGPCPECANCGGANKCMSSSCVLPPGSEAGMCDNAPIDDDCDGLIDCADSDCVGDPACDCDSGQTFCETGAICPGFVCNGHTCWDIGAGESSVNTCCGDSGDPGETYLYRGDEGGNSCDNTTNEYCVFGGDDTSDEACCNPSADPGFFKCAYNGVCYEHLATIDLGGTGPGAYCYDNKNWIDCDVNIGTCNNCIAGAFVTGGELAQFGEYDSGNSTECCGDDANEFLATQGPGIVAHGSKCCNSVLNHGLVGDTGSCIECIANGASDGGNPTWCCSNYSQNGICCKSGTCCTDDSACGSNSCSDNCNYTHPYCDTGSGDYNCKSSNESCSAGTHCVGGATPCAPAIEICGDGIDQDCDGEDLPCCFWQDDGCGKHGCDIWTERGEICMPDPCTGGDNCFGQLPRCVEDEFCSTFGLPDRTIMEILLDVVDWLLGIIAALAFLMIVIGGVVYLSSSGDPTRIETAKKIVTYAIVGLIIAGVSYTVIHVVFDVLQ